MDAPIETVAVFIGGIDEHEFFQHMIRSGVMSLVLNKQNGTLKIGIFKVSVVTIGPAKFIDGILFGKWTLCIEHGKGIIGLCVSALDFFGFFIVLFGLFIFSHLSEIYMTEVKACFSIRPEM